MLGFWLLILLAGQSAQRAAVQFLPATGPEFVRWREDHPQWVDGPCALWLSAERIHAVDDRTVLLGGDVRSAAATYRSVLLRSTDGGRSWGEVLSPVLGSAVLAFSFPRASQGFALVGWVVEGPGSLLLYSTHSSGRKWRKVAEVPKPHPLDAVSDLTCSSPRHCQLTLDCPEGREGSRHVLESFDGGRTWHADDAAAAAAQPTRPQPTGARWRAAEGHGGADLRIERRATDTAAWTTVAVLPSRFTRTPDGRLTACRR